MIDAHIRARFGIDPDTLSDEDWISLELERRYLEDCEDKRWRRNFREALIPILNELFK